MDRYSFKIIARAGDPNDVLIGQFLPNGCWVPELEEYSQDTLDVGWITLEDAWSRIRAFCPEEIDWDSVTRLEIMYDEFSFPSSRGKWQLYIHFTDDNHETIDLRPTVTVGREDEEDFQRKVFEYLSQPDIIGLQETKKLHWVIKCGLGGSFNSDVNEGSTNSTAANHEFHLIWRKSSDPNDSDDDSITGER